MLYDGRQNILILPIGMIAVVVVDVVLSRIRDDLRIECSSSLSFDCSFLKSLKTCCGVSCSRMRLMHYLSALPTYVC